MSDLLLANKELRDTVGRVNAQIKRVSKDGSYSEKYIEDFKANQQRVIVDLARDVHARAYQRADALRLAAKDAYLSGDAFSDKEAALFRDFTAAANTDALTALVSDSADLNAEQVLILGGELRRRGKDSFADLLCSTRPVNAEPWREMDWWKEADELIYDFECADAAEQVAIQCGIATGSPYVMTSEGPHPLEDFLL